MKCAAILLLGIFIGSLLNGEKAKERGFYAGKWMRENIFRLPPITDEDYKP